MLTRGGATGNAGASKDIVAWSGPTAAVVRGARRTRGVALGAAAFGEATPCEAGRVVTPCGGTLRGAMACGATLRGAMACGATLRGAMPCGATLRGAMPCGAMLGSGTLDGGTLRG